MNPSSQHAEQAKKILARRANANNNETGKATKPVPKAVKPTDLSDDATYEGKSLNDLRTMCVEHKVKYKNKHDAKVLIQKLKATAK